jgi:GT2 family glycosyltransferase
MTPRQSAADACSPARFAVVIVNHNDRDNLRLCLASIPAGVATVVVDNASTDGSVDLVRADYPWAQVLADGTNPGYGAAANKGIRLCSTDYVLLLNTDTVLAADTLRTLQEYLDEQPAAAIAGPCLVNPDGSVQASVFPMPGTLRWLLENDPVAPVLGLVAGARKKFYRFAPPTRPTSVPWVLGAVLAIRRDAFLEVGGFDETFFLYFEEVDLCARIRAAGGEVHFVPTTAVVHTGGTSTSQVRTRAAVEHFRSTLRFYRRHYRGSRLHTWLLLMRMKMLARLLRDGAMLVVTRDRDARARLRADVAGWREALRQSGR